MPMGTRTAHFSSVLVTVQRRVFSLLMHGDWPVNPCHPTQIAAGGVGNTGHRLLQATGRTPLTAFLWGRVIGFIRGFCDNTSHPDRVLLTGWELFAGRNSILSDNHL